MFDPFSNWSACQACDTYLERGPSPAKVTQHPSSSSSLPQHLDILELRMQLPVNGMLQPHWQRISILYKTYNASVSFIPVKHDGILALIKIVPQ